MKTKSSLQKTKVMKLITLIATVLLSLFITSCNNMFAQLTTEGAARASGSKGFVFITMSTARAALLPTGYSLSTDKTISYTLNGAYSDNETTVTKTWAADGTTPAYETMCADESILVDAGEWDFTLTVLNGTATVLTKTITKTIVSGANTLAFGELEEPVGGTGSFSVSFSFPTNLIQKVTGGLYTLDGDEVTGFTEDFTADSDDDATKITTGASYDSLTYTESSVPYGSYVIKFLLYYQEVGTSTYSLANTFCEYIRVATGCLTEGTCTTDSVDTMYSITYVLGENKAGDKGTFASTAFGSFNQYETITLPTDVSLTGYTFAGWYTDDAFTSGNELTGWNPDEQTTNITVYAKWTPNVYTITLSSASATNSYTTAVYEKYDTGWYTDEVCTTEMSTTENAIATLPTKTGYTATGFFSATSGGTQYIAADGKITEAVSNNLFTTNTTLYGQWSLNKVKWLFVRATGNNEVKISWVNPTSAVTKATITYKLTDAEEGTSIEITDTSYRFTGLDAGKYTFAVTVTDDTLVSEAKSANGQSYGNLLSGITVDTTAYANSSFVNVMEDKTTITGTNDNYGYYTKLQQETTNTFFGGQFFTGRNVTLTHTYALNSYTVTQSLWTAVMSNTSINTKGVTTTPSSNTRVVEGSGEDATLLPVEKLYYYEILYFCNCLSDVYGLDEVYTIASPTVNNNRMTKATVTADLSKNGFRLPTDAEWEFAARGGDPSAAEWRYAFAGEEPDANHNVASDLEIKSAATAWSTNAFLDAVGWYGCNSSVCWEGNSSGKTHSVGSKNKANALGLYDMSGNVWEAVWDKSIKLETSTTTEFVDPSSDISFSGTNGVYGRRGGCFDSAPEWSTVSTRCGRVMNKLSASTGFRLCRTTGTYPTEE